MFVNQYGKIYYHISLVIKHICVK